MMVELIGVDLMEANEEMHATNGAHAQSSYLASDFASSLEEAQLGDQKGDVWRWSWIDNTLFGYTLLYLVGITFFTDQRATYVDLSYLETFVTSIWFTTFV